jgi:hypothetical protein
MENTISQAFNRHPAGYVSRDTFHENIDHAGQFKNIGHIVEADHSL